MMTDWPWYEIVNSPTDLQQGDILEQIVVPALRRGTGEVVEEIYNLVVMTQSCDIEDDISHIVLCPIWTREELAKFESSFSNGGMTGNLLKGRVIGFYPLSKCEIPGSERIWRIVQFQRILEIDRDDIFDQLTAMGERLRLLPPYRESLAQQFARYFMRVGLPIPVDTSH